MDLKPFVDQLAIGGGSPVMRHDVQRAIVAADRALRLAQHVRALHQDVTSRAERAQRLAHRADAMATHAHDLAITAQALARR